LIPKKSRQELFQRIFALGIFLGGVSYYAATPLIVALSLLHSDITRFRPWSPIATEDHLDRAMEVGLAKDLSAPPHTNLPTNEGSPLKQHCTM